MTDTKILARGRYAVTLDRLHPLVVVAAAHHLDLVGEAIKLVEATAAARGITLAEACDVVNDGGSWAFITYSADEA